MKKQKISIMFVTTILLILVLIGITYAYFTAIVTNGDKGSSVIIKTGSLRLVYEDTQYINISSMSQGDSVSKMVTVTNEGNLPAYYDLVWIELVNNIVNKSGLAISITCASSTDSCDGLDETTVNNSGTNMPILYDTEIGALEVHTYVIKIEYKELGINQNDDQGKSVSGKIGIIESGNYTTNLYGRVYDENSSAIANAIVEIHSDAKSTTTDANGYYSIENIMLGNHTVTVYNSDKTSTIMTTDLSITYADSFSLNGTQAKLTTQSKSLGLELYATTTPTIGLLNVLKAKVYGETYYAYQSSITSIALDDNINIPGDAVSTWDVSEDQNSTVMAYIKSDGVSGYDLHIQAKYGMYAPENSYNLFSYFNKVTTITGLDFLDTSNVTNMSYMFSGLTLLTSLDVVDFNTSKVTKMYNMFYGCNTLTTLDLSNWATSKVTDMYDMFKMDNLVSLNLTNWDFSGLTSSSGMNYLFSSIHKLQTINFTNVNTSNVTNMSYLFYSSESLTTLDLSDFDTEDVTTMYRMFSYNTNLLSVDLTGWDTSSLTNMYNMFYQCSAITSLDLSSFDTSKVTNMQTPFYGMTELKTLNIKNFSLASITHYIDGIFHNAYNSSSLNKLESIDISNIDTSTVTSMDEMFRGLAGLKSIDLSALDTQNVTIMDEMFSDCSSLTSLDLSSLNTDKVTSTYQMFYNTSSLTSLNIRNMSFNNVTYYYNMFGNAKTGLTITVKDASAQTFINARLTDASITGTVTIAS